MPTARAAWKGEHSLERSPVFGVDEKTQVLNQLLIEFLELLPYIGIDRPQRANVGRTNHHLMLKGVRSGSPIITVARSGGTNQDDKRELEETSDSTGVYDGFHFSKFFADFSRQGRQCREELIDH